MDAECSRRAAMWEVLRNEGLPFEGLMLSKDLFPYGLCLHTRENGERPTLNFEDLPCDVKAKDVSKSSYNADHCGDWLNALHALLVVCRQKS